MNWWEKKLDIKAFPPCVKTTGIVILVLNAVSILLSGIFLLADIKIPFSPLVYIIPFFVVLAMAVVYFLYLLLARKC